MLFKEKLKKLRKGQNLTQEQLAEKLNVSRQAITKWETSDGTPDIENLKQISNFFNISIDELIKEENLELKSNKKYTYTEEFEIDHSKHYDINICQIKELNITSNSEEKVKINISSDTNENIKDILKIKFDNLYNKLDIDIIKNKKSNVDNNDFKITIYLPQKYIDDIEINTKAKTMNIESLELEQLEFDGILKYMNVSKSKGNIALNTSKCDVEVIYDKFEGSLEVNLINSTARVQIPKETKYKTILKGIKNKFLDEGATPDAENTIELNGINSKLIVNG